MSDRPTKLPPRREIPPESGNEPQHQSLPRVIPPLPGPEKIDWKKKGLELLGILGGGALAVFIASRLPQAIGGKMGAAGVWGSVLLLAGWLVCLTRDRD